MMADTSSDDEPEGNLLFGNIGPNELQITRTIMDDLFTGKWNCETLNHRHPDSYP